MINFPSPVSRLLVPKRHIHMHLDLLRHLQDAEELAEAADLVVLEIERGGAANSHAIAEEYQGGGKLDLLGYPVNQELAPQ